MLWTELKTRYRKQGGLQLVNMVNIKFTNLTYLLPQIQVSQENYTRIASNGHSNLSEDLTTFMFCFRLPESYDATTQQYLDNITSIANYKLMDIITHVLQEKSRRKAQSTKGGMSLNKFSITKDLGQKCAKCGKLTTAHKITGQGRNIQIWARGNNPQIVKFLREQKG